MSAQAAFVRSWSVGRFRATLSCPALKAGAAAIGTIEWDPCKPPKLTPDEVGQYMAGLEAAVQEMGEQFGLTKASIDL